MDNTEERLLELFAGGHPLSDITPAQEAAVDQYMREGPNLSPEQQAEVDRMMLLFSEPN